MKPSHSPTNPLVRKISDTIIMYLRCDMDHRRDK
jgi:hypothetical protein